jgi:hypothetical protein
MQEIGTGSAKPSGNIQHGLTLGEKEYEKKKHLNARAGKQKENDAPLDFFVNTIDNMFFLD